MCCQGAWNDVSGNLKSDQYPVKVYPSHPYAVECILSASFLVVYETSVFTTRLVISRHIHHSKSNLQHIRQSNLYELLPI
jgi:hypothetical protein